MIGKRISKTILIGIMISLIFIFSGCNKQNNNNDNKENVVKNSEVQSAKNSNNEEETINNIVVQDAILEDGTLLTIIKNNNDYDVESLYIQPIFYDSNNEVVGTAESGFRVVKSGNEVAINDYDVPSEFDRYELKIKIKEKLGYNSYTDKINITSKDTGEKIMVTAINDSNVNLEMLSIGVVFYREGNAVGFTESTEWNIEKGDTAYFNVMYPYDKSFDNIKFDEYKVFINSAYKNY